MAKAFLAAVLALGLCVPVYAEQFTNTGSDLYENPESADSAMEWDTVDKTSKLKEMGQNLPVHLSADHSEYDNSSGDFVVSGNVVITQGKEKLLADYAVGNMKTGDIWLDDGGTLVEPESRMNGKWVHYNFNNKTGEIKEISGKGLKDWYRAPHAEIQPDKIIIDQGGVTTRCPALKNEPCLAIRAKTFEIYPKEKIVAHDVKVYVKGKHIYSRDLWVNNFDENPTKIVPRIGWNGKKTGFYGKLDISKDFSSKTSVHADITEYSRVGFRPTYELKQNERNFSIQYMHGWDEDDDIWYKKHNNWLLKYKKHHIIDGLPLTYSGYFEYGQWQRENRHYKSWHMESAVYLNHDPIYLFNSRNTALYLTIGRKWVHESYTGDMRTTDLYYSTLRQKLGSHWSTWIGYYRENLTSSLFDIGQPDMARELRNGLQYKMDDKNIFSIVNRYDIGKHSQYKTYYRWEHRFCCWSLMLEYEKRYYKNRESTLRIKYELLGW